VLGCRRTSWPRDDGGWPAGIAAAAFALLAAVPWQASAQVAPEAKLRAQTVQAGGATQPSIAVRPLIVAEPASQMPLQLEISPSGAMPKHAFIRLRGLPAMASLSVGHSIAPGSWAVPLNGLPRLALLLPATASGKSELVVNLVGEDGAVLAEARVSLVIVPAGQVAPADKGAKAAEPRPQTPSLTPAERESAEKLVARGKRDLEQGNVAQARQFFLRAAQAGLAHGALMLATTYDPHELARMGAVGIQANLAEAKKWYARAAELGSAEAARRLVALGGT
jgi:hypothetical protein